MATMEDDDGELKSYRITMDRKPAWWWLLTSRRSQAWEDDEVKETRQENWSWAWTIVKYSSNTYKRWSRFERKYLWVERDCGCSFNRFTGKKKMIRFRCPEHCSISKWATEHGLEGFDKEEEE